jgi:hypothetical protein
MIGSLRICGQRGDESARQEIEQLLDLIEPFETSFAALVMAEQGTVAASREPAMALSAADPAAPQSPRNLV